MQNAALSGVRFQQHQAVEASPLNDEMMLFHAATGKFCLLNRTSTSIWSQLHESRTVEEIADAIAERFRDVSKADALRDVESALREMLALEVVVRDSK